MALACASDCTKRRCWRVWWSAASPKATSSKWRWSSAPDSSTTPLEKWEPWFMFFHCPVVHCIVCQALCVLSVLTNASGLCLRNKKHKQALPVGGSLMFLSCVWQESSFVVDIKVVRSQFGFVSTACKPFLLDTCLSSTGSNFLRGPSVRRVQTGRERDCVVCERTVHPVCHHVNPPCETGYCHFRLVILVRVEIKRTSFPYIRQWLYVRWH